MKPLHLIRCKSVAALAAAALMACLGAAGEAQAAGGWQANDDDSLLLEMQVGKYRMQGELRGYQTDRGVCVDLADTIQMLDLPVRLDRKSRRAAGWLFSEDRTFTLDRDGDSVEIMNRRMPLSQAISMIRPKVGVWIAAFWPAGSAQDCGTICIMPL